MTDTTMKATPLSSDERTALARQLYFESLENGTPLSGKALAAELQMSERWGRNAVKAFKADAAPTTVRSTPEASQAVALPVVDKATAVVTESADVKPKRKYTRRAKANASSDRIVFWAIFLVPLIASIASNIASANAAIGPRLIAALPPVLLLGAIEGIQRLNLRARSVWARILVYTSLLVVAGVAAQASYSHQVQLFMAFGEPAARTLPIAIDALLTIGAFALVTSKGKDK